MNAERQYSDEDAIVVWPRSQRWVALAGNNVERMIDVLLKSCEQNSEPEMELKWKCRTVLNRLVADCRSYGMNESVKKMLKCLVALDDRDLAMEFVAIFGQHPQVYPYLEHQLSCPLSSRSSAARFNTPCWKALAQNRSRLPRITSLRLCSCAGNI